MEIALQITYLYLQKKTLWLILNDMKLISKDGEKAQCHWKVALVFAIIKNGDTDFS